MGADRQHQAHGSGSTLAACVTSILFTATANAQQSTSTSSAADLEEVVVTGFRGSLNSALEDKRTETAAIDSIKAEDIGKFPDRNLAESMQRVPGVTLSRGDGGEGRNISVRGLGPTFTRVRINGMEGAAQTGSSDTGQRSAGQQVDDISRCFSVVQLQRQLHADSGSAESQRRTQHALHRQRARGHALRNAHRPHVYVRCDV